MEARHWGPTEWTAVGCLRLDLRCLHQALDAADEPALSELLRATHIETNGATILFDVYLEESLIDQLKDL